MGWAWKARAAAICSYLLLLANQLLLYVHSRWVATCPHILIALAALVIGGGMGAFYAPTLSAPIIPVHPCGLGLPAMAFLCPS